MFVAFTGSYSKRWANHSKNSARNVEIFSISLDFQKSFKILSGIFKHFSEFLRHFRIFRLEIYEDF